MGTRARLSGHYVDEDGEPISGASVYIYQQHSTTDQITAAPTSATIYTADSDHPTDSAETTTLPLTTANDGSWGLFTANALRVDIKITKSGKEDYWLYGQDISKNPSASITIQEEGSALTQRSTINFIGSTVTAADDAANGRTNVTISAAAETLPASVIDAKGDLIVGSANDAADNLTVGANDTFLVADSGQTLGVKWANAATVRTALDVPTTGEAVLDTLVDAKGDLLAATAADAIARVAIGTDGHVLTADAASTPGLKWAALPAAGNYTQIATSTLGSTTASFDFTSIPATYEHLVLVFQLRSSDPSVGGEDILHMRFNNDSGGNYDNQFMRGSNTNITAGQTLAAAQNVIGNCANDTAPANAASSGVIEIPNYRRTTFHKQFVSRIFGKRGTAAADTLYYQYFGFWRDTSAINRITLYCTTGSLLTGSTATLYGTS